MRENKLILSVRFTFVVILICGFFIIPLISGGSNFNIPIYIETSAGIEKANYDDLVEILFNHDFEIQEKQESVPEEVCSLRAKGGSLKIDGISINEIDFSFNIPSRNAGPGKGSLTAQKNRNRFSLSFEIKEILKTNSEMLILKATGKGTLNKKALNFDNIIIGFDKISNMAAIAGTGDKDFQATDLEAVSTKFCSGGEQNFYLLIDKGKLKRGRSAQEVTKILYSDPKFLDVYWNLEKIHKTYWWINIPEGNPGSIWTTKNDCGNYEQNVNQYSAGENVYINGENFKPGTYSWEIKGQPGNASCDPNEVVASGMLSVGNSGAFCFKAYQVQDKDCKEYKVDFNNKYDNYNVIPEFSTFAGILTLISAVAVFFLVRKK